MASEQLAAELQATLPALQLQRDKLEEEVANLQALLSHERTAHSHVSRLRVELEGILFLIGIEFCRLS